MRAAYLAGKIFQSGEVLTIDGDSHHHLSNVIRLKNNEKIILLNGLGHTAMARAVEISKRQTRLQIDDVQLSEAKRTSCDVLLLVPKRDALDSMLKIATEMGVRRIYLLKSQHSPEKLPEERRVKALLQSALEQSNNAWMPSVIFCTGWDDFPAAQYDEILLMDVVSERMDLAKTVRMPGQSSLLVVGPEGGYTSDERQRMCTWPQMRILALETPILRAPTALAAGLGWFHARA